MPPARTLSGEEAQKLIEGILAQTADDFLLHLNWKPKERKPGEIKQHLSIHGTWNADEILATSKGRNEQLQELIMRSMKGKEEGGLEKKN